MALHQDILPIPSPTMLYHGDQYQDTSSLIQPKLECQGVTETLNSAGPQVLSCAFRAQKVPGTRCPTCALAGKEVWIYPRVEFWLLLPWFKACLRAQCQDVVEHFSPLRTTGLWISNVS
ncbi:uncharacterized protein FFB20_02337 [Fusarium fujikuroi]|nr:uncharacterized protein FFB20_02337 [Fusarium fujikuroi]SCN81811.1 uncharacterized protein FFE2_04800 [Fusarium fujikuroi]SCV35163.1 uncharacterized protein FFFS_04617 [Fusarium fujikuroi]